MAQVTIEVDDTGKIVGTLPAEAQKLFDTARNDGYAKGASAKEAEAKAAIEAAQKAANSGDPVAIEKLKAAELENSKLKEAEALRQKNYDEANKIAAERHANEIKEREEKLTAAQKEIERRTDRIRVAIKSDIRAAAMKAGARNESLAELESLLGGAVDLDKDLNAFVKGADGKPLSVKVKDAKGVETEQPVTVEAFVADYLNTHPHHKAAATQRGGNVTGGRTFVSGSQPKSGNSEFDASLEQVAAQPGDIKAVAGAMSNILKRQSGR